jgi:hypothetical protein
LNGIDTTHVLGNFWGRREREEEEEEEERLIDIKLDHHQ